MGLRVCNKCGEEKPHYKNQNQCKDCKKIYNRMWSKTPKGKAIAKKGSDKWRKTGQGVYGIFVGNSCYYIGESSQLNNRISAHKTGIRNPSSARAYFRPLYTLLQNKNYEIRVLEETPNHKEQELKWIEYMCPLYNIYS